MTAPDVEAALSQLGSTAGEVEARVLPNPEAHRRDPSRCPVALYLKQATGEDNLTCGTTGVSVGGRRRIALPLPVTEFILDYDKGYR